MGEPEELGLMGGMGNQDIETPVVEGSTSLQEVESFPEEQAVQGWAWILLFLKS
jgi:hypothetical protein